MNVYYPSTNIEVKQGDILYSSISKSTYFVGHTVMIGSDYLVKESIPGKPSGHSLTIEQMWNRHHRGDSITLLRSDEGANLAAQWVTNNLSFVKDYSLLHWNVHQIEKNYCSKLIVQAYYLGANIQLVDCFHRFISPQYLKKTKKLHKIAVFIV